MTKTQVEVITSVQRRRRWPRAEKERIVAAAIAPGANASDVARAAGVHVSQLFRWRKELCSRPPAAAMFSAVAVIPDAGALPAASIEIEFASGTRLRITGSADPSMVRTAIVALAKIERRRR
jgi:transposase